MPGLRVAGLRDDLCPRADLRRAPPPLPPAAPAPRLRRVASPEHGSGRVIAMAGGHRRRARCRRRAGTVPRSRGCGKWVALTARSVRPGSLKGRDPVPTSQTDPNNAIRRHFVSHYEILRDIERNANTAALYDNPDGRRRQCVVCFRSFDAPARVGDGGRGGRFDATAGRHAGSVAPTPSGADFRALGATAPTPRAAASSSPSKPAVAGSQRVRWSAHHHGRSRSSAARRAGSPAAGRRPATRVAAHESGAPLRNRRCNRPDGCNSYRSARVGPRADVGPPGVALRAAAAISCDRGDLGNLCSPWPLRHRR